MNFYVSSRVPRAPCLRLGSRSGSVPPRRLQRVTDPTAADRAAGQHRRRRRGRRYASWLSRVRRYDRRHPGGGPPLNRTPRASSSSTPSPSGATRALAKERRLPTRRFEIRSQSAARLINAVLSMHRGTGDLVVIARIAGLGPAIRCSSRAR